eukprot:m.308865 g.308865  ORF g.308865 m.308865 type:complete len:668 (+) comp44968_c0_seq1:77-2080(+)
MSKAPDGPAATSFVSPTKVGSVMKLGGKDGHGGWQKRYVVLDHHYLFYFKTEKDKKPSGDVCLADYDCCQHNEECKESKFAFLISSSQGDPGGEPMRTYHWHCKDQDEMLEWIEAINLEMQPGTRHPTEMMKQAPPRKSSTDKKKPSVLAGLKNSFKGKKKGKEVNSVDKAALEQVSKEAEKALLHVVRPKGQNRRPPTREALKKRASAIPEDLFAIEEPLESGTVAAPTPPKKPKPSPSPKVSAMKPPTPGKKPGVMNPKPAPRPRPPTMGKSAAGGTSPKPTPRPRPAPKKDELKVDKMDDERGNVGGEKLPKKDKMEVEVGGVEADTSSMENGSKSSAVSSPLKTPGSPSLPRIAIIPEVDDVQTNEKDGKTPERDGLLNSRESSGDAMESEPEKPGSPPAAKTEVEEKEQKEEKEKPEVEAEENVKEEKNGELAEELGFDVIQTNEVEQVTDPASAEKESAGKASSAEVGEKVVPVSEGKEMTPREEEEPKDTSDDTAMGDSKSKEKSDEVEEEKEKVKVPTSDKPDDLRKEEVKKMNEPLEDDKKESVKEAKPEEREVKAEEKVTVADEAAVSRQVKPVEADDVFSAADAVPIWVGIADPQTALEKAKEILRLAHNARIEAKKELAAAKMAREEAEISKKTAKEILKLARQSLHEIKPAKMK